MLQTRNYTSGLWGNFTVGTAATSMLLHAYDILNIGAMVPLAVVFILLVKARYLLYQTQGSFVVIPHISLHFIMFLIKKLGI